ncbi:MAG: hypothetical protein QXS85_03030 [Acidilobaceae archaeon]
MSSRGGKISFIKIYALNHKPSSGCNFFSVEEKQGVYVARCSLLEHYIPSPSVHKCESLWEHCPYRRLYFQVMGERQPLA